MKSCCYLLAVLTNMLAGCTALSATHNPAEHDNSPAATLYRTRCSACHALPDPRRLSFTGWQAVIPVMQHRMHERGMDALDPQQRQTLLAWLKAHSR